MLNISFMELASLDTLHHSQTVFVDVRILEATQFLLSDTGQFERSQSSLDLARRWENT